MLKLEKIFLVLVLACTLLIHNQALVIPITGSSNTQDITEIKKTESVKLLDAFSKSLINGRPNQIVGVFVENTFDFPIVQQPTTNPAYVSTHEDTVTQFSMASNYGSIGLIAHNNLAGAQFADLNTGDGIVLVYGDGSTRAYKIQEIDEFQALSPRSPYSNFVDLKAPNKTLSAASVFMSVYNPDDRLILQTCIAKDGIDSWGRLFVIAESVKDLPLSY